METEIEKFRGDGNWSRVLDLSRQLSAKTPHLGNCHDIFAVVYILYVSRVRLKDADNADNADEGN